VNQYLRQHRAAAATAQTTVTLAPPPGWELSLDDFAALRYGNANDELPEPICFTSRFADLDEAGMHRRAVLAKYGTEEYAGLRTAMDLLSLPPVRLTALAASDGTTTRIAAGRHSTAAVFAVQHTETVSIRLHRTTADGLTAELVAALPSCVAGKRSYFTATHREIAGETGSYLESATRLSPAQEYRQYYGPAKRVGSGIISVQGSELGAQRGYGSIEWFDIAGDGRYLETRDNYHVTVTPAEPRHLIEALAKPLRDAIYDTQQR
jgi:hypothetical protein